MKTFLELEFKEHYDSQKDDLLNDFYIPALANSKKYRRVVGYFNSKSLASVAIGLKDFILNGGKMDLLCGVDLNPSDVNMVKFASEHPEEILTSGFLQELNSIEDESIQLTITSPSIPSNKYVDDYNGEFDKLPYDPYLERMSYVMNELYRVTKMGGYVAFVVTDYRNIKYDEPYVELHSDIARVGKDAGFLYQDCIIYDHNDQRGLLSQGYPKIFYANLNHTYVVILRKAR